MLLSSSLSKFNFSLIYIFLSIYWLIYFSIHTPMSYVPVFLSIELRNLYISLFSYLFIFYLSILLSIYLLSIYSFIFLFYLSILLSIYFLSIFLSIVQQMWINQWLVLWQLNLEIQVSNIKFETDLVQL